jgi:hypothetical protein
MSSVAVRPLRIPADAVSPFLRERILREALPL